MPGQPSATPAQQGKAELRAQLLAWRRTRSESQRATARAAINRHVLAWCERRRPAVVAGYLPLASEPGSRELLAALVGQGSRVLVPVVRPDRDLGWRLWSPREPPISPMAPVSGEVLAPGAIEEAALILVPALAVARDGTRLGRGGGSYDRALSRRAPHAVAAALLYDDELVDQLPADSWDVAVHAVVRPTAGWEWVGSAASQAGGSDTSGECRGAGRR